MKKTLVALAVAAAAVASTANAGVVYDKDGTTIEASASLRIAVERANQDKNTVGKNSHTRLFNEGSRFDVKVTHALNDSAYVLGYYQARFDGSDTSDARAKNDNFGDLTTRKAYVGFGLKHSDAAKSELTAGRQDTILDDVGLADDYLYGLLKKGFIGATTKKDAIRYDYFLKTDAQNLQLSTSYVFADGKRSDDDNNLLHDGELKNALALGLVYDVKVGPGKVLVDAGFGRTQYDNNVVENSHKTGYGLSVGYTFSRYTFSVDSAYFDAKNIVSVKAAGIKYDGDSKGWYVSPGFQVGIIKDGDDDISRVYGNYIFKQEKTTDRAEQEKVKTRGFLLGADYKLNKQVITYVEGKYVTAKGYKNGNYVHASKTHDKAIGVGVRVLF